MNSDIETLQERIAQGGNWMAFRDEIAALHARAANEAEYVRLLEAFQKLLAVGEHAYDTETWAKLLPATRSEYKMFLNTEAMEDGVINPVLLERITRREVEAGRMDPEDGLRKLAIAGAAVLGDSAELTSHKCKRGDWFFFGAAGAAILAVGVERVGVSPFWLIAVALIVGWYLNERERRRIKRKTHERRHA